MQYLKWYWVCSESSPIKFVIVGQQFLLLPVRHHISTSLCLSLTNFLAKIKSEHAFLKWYFFVLHKCWQIKTNREYNNANKGAVINTNPIQVLSNSANISSGSARCPFCVCTENYLVLLHNTDSVNRETNEMAWPELRHTISKGVGGWRLYSKLDRVSNYEQALLGVIMLQILI